MPYRRTAAYERVASAMATSHIGKTVVDVYPTPNCLIAPSGVYKNAGLMNCSPTKSRVNSAVATRGAFRRTINRSIPAIVLDRN